MPARKDWESPLDWVLSLTPEKFADLLAEAKHDERLIDDLVRERAADPDGMPQDDIDKQWPGFVVKCKACGSTRITVDDSRGWSEVSGAWGSVDWRCLGCGYQSVIVEN